MIYCEHPYVMHDATRVPSTWEIPCGKCALCLAKKRREWSTRLNIELENSISAYFITLTYSDEHLPEKVSKDHVQRWLKRFRKLVAPARVRYFLVSEYSPAPNFRPHYHLLLYNYPYGRDSLREDLKRTWHYCEPFMFDYGDAVGDVEEASILYVCKYCLNSLASDDVDLRTFMLCSRRPGIGESYIDPQMCGYVRRRFDGQTVFKGTQTPLPRYLRNKMFTAPEREIISALQYLKNERTLTYRYPGLSVDEADKLNRQLLRDKAKKIRESLK